MNFTRADTRGDNICVIWIDDMIDIFTWRTAFGLTISTPNIDRFMGEGVRFANAYATVPLCAPCRAELATGLSPFRTGLVDLNRFWRDVLPPTAGWQFDLRRAGFRTFTTGKVDSNYKPMPEEYKRILFHEEPEARDSGRRSKVKDYLNKGPGISGVNHPDDDGSQDSKFYDYTVAQNAIEYLDRADPARRHLIQLGFKHPHYKLQCPDRFYQTYDPADIIWPSTAAPEDYFGPQDGMAVYEAAYITNGPWTPEKAGDHAWREVVRAYFAAISHVDHEIGRFMDALRSSGLADNTTVILLSDNGFNLGTHDSFHKMSQWDSAAHVPLGIWSARLDPKVVDMPVSLHNIPKTILDLAGLPYRPDWVSGQSLLPLIDASFGAYDRSKSPVTSVFGTLSIRPATKDLSRFRYFRYPNGEEHIYDLVDDPGETTNIADTGPLKELRQALVDNALELGLDLRGFENPERGINAMMSLDGSVVMAGGNADNSYWAYGADAENIREDQDGGEDTLWYMGGPDDYVLHAPAYVENIRIATVVSRSEDNPSESKRLDIVAHPDTPINFETSERVTVNVRGSRGDDVMIGPKYGGAEFHGGGGNDTLIATSGRRKDVHKFYGGAGNDTLIGGNGRDILDGGSGHDVIKGGDGHSTIYGGPGNDDISDGEGGSEIHTGPGRNTVRSAGGDDRMFIGAGHNRIEPGPGKSVFQIAYGGVTEFSEWRDDYSLDLSTWPQRPKILINPNGTAIINLGVGFIRISTQASKASLEAQIVQSSPTT
ncbi:sulfatase-like hydrolase/transferase [Aliiroseovarius sp. F47248L]|uniref:sulfatase-like hydrolase/transferase n=1 Tax=Aliiroseovarius sp. F47248L TaxID=2926420 RepID=UPI001FF6C069|nr:sulfatase-like hydrolase/transferase [Aliiroseovarius sp. F47248L]MCK0140603.1 sulfatase-like hydrolase/transferase [Aliiroseovarius sp. F47248L]